MAITANELRIGNYLKNDGVVVKIDARSIFDIWGGNLITRIKKYEPIHITEDWLLKFGFVLRGFYYHFPNHEIFKLEQYKLNNAYFLRHGNESLDSVRINYVHQLQNLYFALTGKELTYGNNHD